MLDNGRPFSEVLDRLEAAIKVARSVSEDQARECSPVDFALSGLRPGEFRIGDFIIQDMKAWQDYWNVKYRYSTGTIHETSQT